MGKEKRDYTQAMLNTPELLDALEYERLQMRANGGRRGWWRKHKLLVAEIFYDNALVELMNVPVITNGNQCHGYLMAT